MLNRILKLTIVVVFALTGLRTDLNIYCLIFRIFLVTIFMTTAFLA